MFSSPPAALHMSTGTLTSFAGRKPGGRTKATRLVLPLLVEMAPLKCTIPEMSATAGVAEPELVAQPLSSVSLVKVTLGAAAAPRAGCGSATAPASRAATANGTDRHSRAARRRGRLVARLRAA